MKQVKTLMVACALLGLAGVGIAGGGVLPFKLGGSATPTRPGLPPQAASVQVSASGRVNPVTARASALDTDSVRARCRQGGLAFHDESGHLTIGSESYPIVGVCADMTSGAREIYASSLNRQVIVVGTLSGAEGSQVLDASVIEKQAGAEATTYRLQLREIP